MEIIKIDAELSECPETGVRYIGFARQTFEYDNGKKSVSWECLSDGMDFPWTYSEEEIIERARKMNAWDGYSVSQVIILKSELPIKKLVLGNE